MAYTAMVLELLKTMKQQAELNDIFMVLFQ